MATPTSRRPSGFSADPMVFAGDEVWDVSGFDDWGATGGDGESIVVSGVTYEYEDEFLVMAAALARDDALLAFELSEPTVLGMSARSMSTSSAVGWAATDVDVCWCGFATA